MLAWRQDRSEALTPVQRNRKRQLSAKGNLEDFARSIEPKLERAAGRDAIANYICRLLTSKDERIAALMWCKWVEWRYGKAKEYLEHSGQDGRPVQIQIISHIPRPGDRDAEGGKE
jgi:hypothetical protein